MKQIGITEISSNNPFIKKYMNTINFWDNEGSFAKSVSEQDPSQSKLFGVFYDDLFLGASVLHLVPDTRIANIHMIIGSTGHKEEIENGFKEELKNLLVSQYGLEEINFANKQNVKQLTKAI